MDRLLAPYYEVETVGDGESALQRILVRPAQRDPGGGDDPAARRREPPAGCLRADPRTRNLPVIALSSRAADWRIEGAQQRADDYVVKPFTAHELLARVTAVLEFARLRRRVEEQTRRWAAEAARRAAERLDVLEQDLASLRRREEVLAQANASLQARLAQLEAVNAGVRDSRRAALNLLEDAVESRRRLQEEMAERRQAEEAVRESEEQFRRAIEEAPVPIVMLAEDGQMLQVSKSWAELTGYSRGGNAHAGRRGWSAPTAPARRKGVARVGGGSCAARRSSEQVGLEVVTRSGERRALDGQRVARRGAARWPALRGGDGAGCDGAAPGRAGAARIRGATAPRGRKRARVRDRLDRPERRITSWNRGAEQIRAIAREEISADRPTSSSPRKTA